MKKALKLHRLKPKLSFFRQKNVIESQHADRKKYTLSFLALLMSSSLAASISSSSILSQISLEIINCIKYILLRDYIFIAEDLS
jgi:hypothetical protein